VRVTVGATVGLFDIAQVVLPNENGPTVSPRSSYRMLSWRILQIRRHSRWAIAPIAWAGPRRGTSRRSKRANIESRECDSRELQGPQTRIASSTASVGRYPLGLYEILREARAISQLAQHPYAYDVLRCLDVPDICGALLTTCQIVMRSAKAARMCLAASNAALTSRKVRPVTPRATLRRQMNVSHNLPSC
jgi:hypothetical protein